MELPLCCHIGAPHIMVSTALPAFIMGIVNVTPDSFWQKSRFSGSQAAEAALAMVADGADIIDIGGESSRPGAEYVSEEEELKRIIPVVEEIRRYSHCPVSIDTRKKNVMQAAYEAGADILNDISALEDDGSLAAYVAKTEIPVILMHKRGNPAIMQKDTEYQDVFAEVNGYLQQRVATALHCGIGNDKIIIDPGIGFGKNLSANRILIQRCGDLCGGKYPVLMALSRKTCIGDMTGRQPQDRLAGTLAANLIAVQNGASILRVHDVRQTCDMLRVLENFTE